MPTLGVHPYLFIGAWETHAGNYAIAQAAKAGFDAIEIPLATLDDFNAKSHRAALKKAGITPICSYSLPRSAHLPRTPEKARSLLGRAMDAAEAAGSTILGGELVFAPGDFSGAPPTRAERQVVVEVLRDLCADAKRRGMTLALEPANRYITYLYNTLEESRATVAEVGADNLLLWGDTYSMNMEEANLRTAIAAAGERLRLLGISESHRGTLGSGTIQWADVWQGLGEIRFDGTLMLRSAGNLHPQAAAALSYWRPNAAGASANALAAQGLEFLRAGIATMETKPQSPPAPKPARKRSAPRKQDAPPPAPETPAAPEPARKTPRKRTTSKSYRPR